MLLHDKFLGLGKINTKPTILGERVTLVKLKLTDMQKVEFDKNESTQNIELFENANYRVVVFPKVYKDKGNEGSVFVTNLGFEDILNNRFDEKDFFKITL